MDNKKFNISVIVPCYNAERYLSDAIESILNQTLLPTEIIIVDDGSNDQSLAVASSFKGRAVRVISCTHQGIAKTRNTGIKEATGNYLAFLDADDLWDVQKLEMQCLAFGKAPTPQGVLGKLQQFLTPDMPDIEKNRYFCPSTPQDGHMIGCLMIKREVFFQIGFFDERLKSGEFIDWYVRAKQKNFIFSMITPVVLYRRIHGNNTVLSHKIELHKEYLKIIRHKIKNAPENDRDHFNGSSN